MLKVPEDALYNLKLLVVYCKIAIPYILIMLCQGFKVLLYCAPFQLSIILPVGLVWLPCDPFSFCQLFQGFQIKKPDSFFEILLIDGFLYLGLKVQLL